MENQKTQFKGKAIYNPSGKAGEYSYWASNFFTGCENDCEYCYCKKGFMLRSWSNSPKLKQCFENEKHAIDVFRMELMTNKKEIQKSGIFFSFTTDPMQPSTLPLTCAAINICRENEVPFKILTKCVGWNIPEFIKELQENGTIWNREPKQHLWAFGFTLTGHDELEKNASPNQHRIEAMKILHNAGFKTFASIEPIVDFASSFSMIKQTLGFCDLYKVGLMSGKKYNVVEAQTFVEQLIELDVATIIYLKESIQKLTKYTNKELGDNFVERDYNLFE